MANTADSSDPQAPSRRCVLWREVVECLEEFEAPVTILDAEGSTISKGWVFRGLQSSTYGLNPRIERPPLGSTDWAGREVLISSEFKARAHMHMPAHSLPQDEITWLALMQHWGVPTRLLDFTYSPFVALYFAIRGRESADEAADARVWALNAEKVNNYFASVAWAAVREQAQHDAKRRGLKSTDTAVSLHPDSYSTVRDDVKRTQRMARLIAEAIDAEGVRRGAQMRSGCVCVASPPSHNTRLASQQGVFLINCTEDLTFRESLNRMMKDSAIDWCKTFDIAGDIIPEIEERLFQMNINEQSLFPDMEGLAGLIRQKARMQWR